MTTSVLLPSPAIPATPLHHSKITTSTATTTTTIPSIQRSSRKRTFLADVSCHKRPRNALALLKQQQQEKKTVRFDLFQNTCASTHFCLLEEPDHAFESHNNNTSRDASCYDNDAELQDCHVLDRGLLWFSPEDLYDIRLREANIVKIHRFCDDYQHTAASMLGLAISCAKPPTAATAAASCDAVQANNNNSEHYYYTLATSPARGLESQIMPCMRQRRKQVVTTFLKSQTSLSLYRPLTLNADLRQRALSEHYQKLARPALLVAQWLAAGDARAVVEAA